MPNSPVETERKPAAVKNDRFKSAMPNIPGVEQRTSASSPAPAPAQESSSRSTWMKVALIVVLAAAGGFAWQRVRASHAKARPADPDPVSQIPVAAAAPALELPQAGPVTIGTVQEMQAAWSTKKFDFIKPETNASVSAMLVRLPGIAGDHSSAYWAFSLAAPYGTCSLELVTDLKELAGRFNYPAAHPMVVAPCDGTVFDPLQMGAIGTGALVRGSVVQGPEIRPPISIRVEVKGHELIADQIE